MVYCVLAYRVRVEAQFKQTFRGGVHTNILRNCELKICLCCSKMAVLFDSDSEEEEFIGFTVELEFERNNPESESDISVSSVNREDLSDLDLSDQESGEEDEQEWNEDPGPVVNPFITNTGTVRDVRGYSTLHFLT